MSTAPLPNRPLLIGALLIAMILAALDQSIVATALPVIASELAGLERLSWVVTLFMLASTISAPLYGKLSDLYGLRRLFLICISVFVLASLLCGLATSMTQLILFRGLQGLGAGGLMTLGQVTVGRTVPFEERGRYQSLFSAAFAVSTALGPVLGGYITTHFDWRWIFLINLPLGLLAMAGLWRALPSLSRRERSQIDYKGAVVLCIATSALLLLTHEGSLGSGGSGVFLGLLGLIAAFGFWLLLRIERRAAEPIIDPALFRSRRYSVAVMATASMAFAMMGSLVFMPLYFQAVLHQTPTESGLMTLPQVVMMLVSSFVGGALSRRKQNYEALLAVGVGLEFLGLSLLLVGTWLGAPAPWFVMTMAVLGAGMGIGMPNATVIVQSAAPMAVMGAATATLSFCRSLGGALGVAVSGAIMGFALREHLAELPSALRQLNLIEGLGHLSAEDLAQLSEPYRAAIHASLFGGALVMGVAFVLVLGLRKVSRPVISES